MFDAKHFDRLESVNVLTIIGNTNLLEIIFEGNGDIIIDFSINAAI